MAGKLPLCKAANSVSFPSAPTPLLLLLLYLSIFSLKITTVVCPVGNSLSLEGTCETDTVMTHCSGRDLARLKPKVGSEPLVAPHAQNVAANLG